MVSNDISSGESIWFIPSVSAGTGRNKPAKNYAKAGCLKFKGQLDGKRVNVIAVTAFGYGEILRTGIFSS